MLVSVVLLMKPFAILCRPWRTRHARVGGAVSDGGGTSSRTCRLADRRSGRNSWCARMKQQAGATLAVALAGAGGCHFDRVGAGGMESRRGVSDGLQPTQFLSFRAPAG